MRRLLSLSKDPPF
jgi:importin subunit alpha-1